MKEFSKEELKRLRKVLRAINCLNGVKLPKKILKKLITFQEWLKTMDLEEQQPRFFGNPVFSWWRRRQQRKLYEHYLESKWIELSLLQLETTIKDQQLGLEKSKLELKFLKRELKKGKKKPSYVR